MDRSTSRDVCRCVRSEVWRGARSDVRRREERGRISILGEKQ